MPSNKVLSPADLATVIVTGFVPQANVVKRPLAGAAARSHAKKVVSDLIGANLVKTGGPRVKRLKADGTFANGRPVEASLAKIANNLEAELPLTVRKAIEGDPVVFAAMMDALSDARRTLDENEEYYISLGYDITAGMGSRESEPLQEDYHTSFPIGAREGQTLGDAMLEQYKGYAMFAQFQANVQQKPLALMFRRYAIDRNARTKEIAEKFYCPTSLVKLPSRWNGQVILTEKLEKEFTGLLGTIKVFYPQEGFNGAQKPRKARKVTKAV